MKQLLDLVFSVNEPLKARFLGPGFRVAPISHFPIEQPGALTDKRDDRDKSICRPGRASKFVAQRGNDSLAQLPDPGPHERGAKAAVGGEFVPMTRLEFLEEVLPADLHGELGRELGVEDSRQQIV